MWGNRMETIHMFSAYWNDIIFDSESKCGNLESYLSMGGGTPAAYFVELVPPELIFNWDPLSRRLAELFDSSVTLMSTLLRPTARLSGLFLIEPIDTKERAEWKTKVHEQQKQDISLKITTGKTLRRRMKKWK